ncbi:MAG: RNA methyltransferase [Deinococcales bacterium]|nr:RNA methyltransferase [Chitinophagaceae bacterium]
MLSKNDVKYIQSLYHKKQRQQEGLFIAEGPKLISELLASKYIIQKIYAVADWVKNNTAVKQPIVVVTNNDLQRISNLQTPNQVLAIVQQQLPITTPVFTNQLSIVVDGIQDPGNLGTIIRNADWFGITQVICSHNTAELYNPKVVQSTMGSFTRTSVWYTDLATVLANVQVPIFGALLQGQSIYQVSKPTAGILVIGNEGNGISNALLPLITNPITIPKIGGAESLNAAVAMGILVSHLVI